MIEGNIREILKYISISKDFLDKTADVQIKGKIDKWNEAKLRSFCTALYTFNKLKMQPTELKNIFSNYTSHKRLRSEIYKELKKLVKANNKEMG